MYARPLGFVWPEDRIARRVEDQLLIGESIMIAPVYEQNAVGRTVYLPEEMKLLRFHGQEVTEERVLPAGHHFLEIPLEEVVLFIRKGCLLPLASGGENVKQVDWNQLKLYGFAEKGDSYELYDDDGVSPHVILEENLRRIVLK